MIQFIPAKDSITSRVIPLSILRSELDLIDVVLAFLISILKIFKLHTNYWHRVTDITSFVKKFGKCFWSYSKLLSKFGAVPFEEYVSKGITHPVFYSKLDYKPRRVKCQANFISSNSKIFKRLRRRLYDQAIIDSTIGIVLGPFTSLCKSFLKRCTLINKAVGTIWQALSKPCPKESWSSSPLIVRRDSFSPLTWTRVQTAPGTSYFIWCRYIFLIYYYITVHVCDPHANDLSTWLAVGPQSLCGGLFIIKCVSFWLHGFCG